MDLILPTEENSLWNLGDANLDGTMSILDVVAIVNFILGSGALISQTPADYNQDGTVSILDVIQMVNAILGFSASSSAVGAEINTEDF